MLFPSSKDRRVADPTHGLAEFTVGLDHEMLPLVIRQRVSDLLVDSLACAFLGRREEGRRQVEQAAIALGGPRSSIVIGGAPNSLPGAVLVNGFQIAGSAMCEFHLRSACHATPSVVPAALAIAERDSLSGRDLVIAVAAGLETIARIGIALGPGQMRSQGWYPSGVIGPFGAAAAVGSLIGLDVEAAQNALSLAGTQSAGTLVQSGTPTLTFQQCMGGFSGLMGALLAAEGFRASRTIFTAERGGLFNIFASGGEPQVLLADIGKTWEIERFSFRRWSVPYPLQTVVDAVIGLGLDKGVAIQNVHHIELAVSQALFDGFVSQQWSSAIDARASLPYVAGVALLDQTCGPRQFGVDRLTDPVLAAFVKERVKVRLDPTMKGREVVASMQTRDGHRRSHQAADVDGDDLLGRREIESRFRSAANGCLADEQVDQALEMLSDIWELGSVRDLCTALNQSGNESS